MNRVLVTGGAGFIGSYVTEHIIERFKSVKVTVLDKMTYAADAENIKAEQVTDCVQLVVGDVCDVDLCKDVVRDMDLVVHLAAESHVDNSFSSSLAFTRTNVLGTHSLLEACRLHQVPRVLHVSTDEVYGEVVEGAAAENSSLNPTNPYSASKASAEMIVKGYVNCYGLPVIGVRANNIFGPRQFPEKLIPRSILCLITGRKIPIHGDGKHIRHYLSVHDFAEAIGVLIEKGRVGEVYNVGTNEAYSNIEVVSMICQYFGQKFEGCVTFVQDRPFNDRRYSINWGKISSLGWRARRQLADELAGLVQWYRDNAHRYAGRTDWVL